MFKSSSRYSYGRRKKRRTSFSWLGLLWIPVGLFALEVILRLFFAGAIDGKTQNSPQNRLYGLTFINERQEPYQAIGQSGPLIMQRDLFTVYSPVPNQSTEIFTINGQGFRDLEDLPMAKPSNEIRIFVLGDSAAFGKGSNDANLISEHLEKRLMERVRDQRQNPSKYRPDVFPTFAASREEVLPLPAKIKQGNYEVITAAVPGYSSGNHLAQFALEILPYKPDAIILMGGYGDLMLDSDKTATDIPVIDDFAQDPVAHYLSYLKQGTKNKLEVSYIYRLAQSFLHSPADDFAEKTLGVAQVGQSLSHYLPDNDEEFQARLDRYQENHSQLIQLAAAANVPVIIATQPEITGRPAEFLSPEEKAIMAKVAGDDDYVARVQEYFPNFWRAAKALERAYPKNVKVINFYNLDQNLNKKLPIPTFSGEPIHLTPEANRVLAEQLYYGLNAMEKMQVVPENFYLD